MPAGMTRIPPSANFIVFTLGSPTNETGRFADEGPQTDVTLTSPFWIGRHEVTQQEYQSVVSNNPSFFSGDPNRPVEMVTYAEATNYCAKLTLRDRQTGLIPAGYGYRLPTEAEWECAARADSSMRFSFGDDETQLNNYAWQADNSSNTTHPVETKLPNAWGLYDMYGNAYEWCQDWYGPYPGGVMSNPQGPATGQYRVIRGGAYNNTSARLCRSALRGNLSPDSRSLFVGFRVILAPVISEQAPVFTSAATASGTVGSPFTYQITANNNPTNYSATGLPAGLNLNSATGHITGTPTAAGTFTITLSAINAGGSGTATLTLTIVPPAPVISSAATASGTVGSPFTYQVTANNNPTNYSATGLPAGLNLNSAIGQISGTPTEAGTFTITLSAINAGGSGTATLTLTIVPPAPVVTSAATASGTVGSSFTYQITANNNPASYSATGLPAGLNLNSVTGQITGTPTEAGTFTITLSAKNAGGTGTATLTLTIVPPAPVISSAATASGTVGSSFTYQIIANNNPANYSATGLPPGLNLNPATGQITGTPAEAGTFTIALSAKNAGGSGTATLTLTIVPPAPVITSAATANGTVGTSFTYQISANNNPTNYSATGLPMGLNLNPATGQITGTPAEAGTFTITLSAKNAGGAGTATLTLTIVPPAPVISSAETAAGTVGSSFIYQITASHNPTNYSATGLPAGLNLNPATGQITGTPTVAGTFTVTLSAANAGGTGTKTLALTITGAAAARIDTGPLMNTARMGHYIAALPDGRVAVFGGHGQGFVSLNSMEIWNSSSNAFASVTMPSSFDGGALVRLADGRYLIAGGAANLGVAPGYKTAQIFDPAAGTVTATASTMVRARCSNSGALLGNGKALIVGGWYSSDSGGYGEIYDPASGTFTATGPLNTARALPMVLPTSDGQAVIAGGSGVFGSPPALERVELYDPTNNTFSVRSEAVFAGETGWRLYTGFGREIGEQRMADGRYALMAYRTVTNVTETVLALFDPGTKQFVKVAMTPSFTDPVSVFVPVVSRGENAGYFLAGSNTGGGANFTFRVYRVNLATGERVAVAEPLSVAAYYLGANAMCWLGDGRIFVTGGTTSVSSTYNFNPVRNTFFVSGLAAVQPAPVIISALTASGAVGTAFTYQITATNDPTSFAAAGLPPDLLLNTRTGLISGLPTVAGTFSVTLTASNASGVGTATVAILITPPVRVVFDNGNIFAVSSRPSKPTTFTVADPFVITYIQNYHYFNGGALPGTISLRHSDGTVYGPWQTYGTTGQGGVANANWITEPMVTLKAGTYSVIDSDPSTWSHNASSGSAGFSLIMGYSLPAVPALSIRLEPDSQVVISWPASATGFFLEAAESLLSSNWHMLTNTPGIVGDQYAVTNSAAGEMRFFRLKKR